VKQFYLTILLVLIFGYSFSQSLFYTEEIIGDTWYDLQTNNSCQNRLYLYDDGTIGAAWTRGMNHPNYTDRGTGYNFYDGLSWQPMPEERIENDRTGWPSYAPLGENGEIVISHYSGADTSGLVYCRRENKGMGDWSFSHFNGPSGHEELFWPRLVTSGVNYENLHLIALTAPVAHGGAIYQGLNGALLYSLSTDQGETWDIQNEILPGMDSTYYDGYLGDSYAFAEPGDNIVAFVAGSYAHDLFLMKSTDGGQTFTKTIIWDHPYDKVNPGFVTDTFYTVDGSLDVEIDVSGKAHVVFGISRCWYDFTYNSWRLDKSIDGVGYWNEERTPFSSNINALNPYDDPDSELIQDYSLVGWAQDIDNDGEITYLYDYFGYGNIGISSMVQLVVDDLNRIFLVFTSVTETYDDGLMNYRRLWFRSSLDGGNTWRDFYHFAENDPQSIFNEYAFPSCASNSDDYLYLTCIIDNEPGIYNQPNENPSYNEISFIKISKEEVVGIENEPISADGFAVSQNTPNPCAGKTTIKVLLPFAGDVLVEVLNVAGQQVYAQTYRGLSAGNNPVILDLSNVETGVYFYLVKFEDQVLVDKMIIR